MALPVLAAALSSSAQAAPTTAVMLLDSDDGVTVLDAFTISAETIEALDLPVIAPPGPLVDASTVALSVQSVEQWTQVLSILTDSGHEPMACSWQRMDGRSRTQGQSTVLSDGVYLFQLDVADTTPQLQVTLYGDALTVE
jgi:hypothetical protein